MQNDSRSFANGSGSIQRACDREAISTLWITGPSMGLDRQLAKVDGLREVTILRDAHTSSPGVRLSEGLLNLIAASVRHGKTRYVIACGQEEAWATAGSRGDVRGPQSAFHDDSLVRRLADRIERQRQVQNQVRLWVEQIQCHSSIRPLVAASRVRIRGLFFIAKSNTFLVYDENLRKFLPIAAER